MSVFWLNYALSAIPASQLESFHRFPAALQRFIGALGVKDFRVVGQCPSESRAVWSSIDKFVSLNPSELDIGGFPQDGGEHFVMGITGTLKRFEKLIT